MTRTHACPIGGERIDATAARLSGALVASIVDFCLGCYLYGFLPGPLAVTFVRSVKTAA